MSNSTMLSKYGNCTRLLKIKNQLKVGKNSWYFVGVFNNLKTIIPLMLVGYGMIIAIHHLLSNAHLWNNC